MLKKILCCLLILLLTFPTAFAQESSVEITDIRTQIGESVVAYPQLAGMADEAVQQAINDDIVLSSGVTDHLITLVTLAQPGASLTVDYKASFAQERYFSVVISVKGSKVGGQRDGHAYFVATYDLETGKRVTLDELFADVEKAVAAMEAIALDTLSDELNGYMEHSDILPLPRESFTLDADGITFWYPSDQFQLLSGYGGACQFWYEELEGLWLHPQTQEMTDVQLAEAVAQSVEKGQLPHIPVQMGQPLSEVTQAYRLLREPDAFPGGRYFVLEDPAFRSVLVLSDALAGDEANAVVEGIQLKRGGLHGLKIGQTSVQQWRAVLGTPEQTIAFSQNMAYDYDLPAGSYDVYRFGGNELRLHADENGLLCAVQICK